MTRFAFLPALAALFLAACGSESLPGTSGDDTGTEQVIGDDTGTSQDDTGTSQDDTGSTEDTGATGDDTGDDTATGDDTGSTDDTGTSGDDCDDADGDGYCADVDCNDYAAAVNPGATEIVDNAVDEDCDGVAEMSPEDTAEPEDTGSAEDTGSTTTCTDADSDGWCVEGGDCDDSDATVSPGATETANDGIDQDCSGSDLVTEADADGDGYGVSTDCDDSDASVHPGATEICNEIDDDCDGSLNEGLDWTWVYADADGDGYGDNSVTSSTCDDTLPTEYGVWVWDNTDCDDSDATVSPGATETANDGIDQDCDGADLVTEADADGDGYGVSTDCDDSDADVHATATWSIDADLDGYGEIGTEMESCGAPGDDYDTVEATDCDDADADVYPGADEIADDGIDQDCDGSDASLSDLQDAATCSSGQEACFRDVDGDGSYETLLMVQSQLYGMPASASVYENGAGTGCGIGGETAEANAGGYYVVSFEGLSSCTSQITVTSGDYWWQNYSFCTDGSDTQGICVNTGGYNYLIDISYNSSSGLSF